MRVKQIWDYVPLPAKLKLVSDRLTFSRLTTTYFIFSVIHCIIQVILQARAFTINVHAAALMNGISLAGNATDDRIPVWEHDQLRLCRDVPLDGFSLSQCDLIWSAGSLNDTVYLSPTNSASVTGTLSPSTSSVLSTDIYSNPSSASAAATSASFDVQTSQMSLGSAVPASAANLGVATVTVVVVPTGTPPVVADSNNDNDEDGGVEGDEDHEGLHKRTTFRAFEQNGQTLINVTLPNDTQAVLDRSCLWALNWPVSILDNTKREDVVFIAFQIWVLGMSIVALLNESIPHIIASLLTHLLATVWSVYQIYHTSQFRAAYARLITNGACDGISLLSDYWNERAKVEFASLALNVVALVVSAVLSWRLFKLFGWQTFKRVGASLTINRIYKLVLVLSITLQLSLFFMGAFVSLWIDQLFNGIAAQVAWYVKLYLASSFITEALLIPWITTGWFAVRKELRAPMFIFLLLSILYLAGFGVMFLATTFRWLYITWQFFAIMATASVLLTVMALVIGVICRYNFGKGLPRYLNAQEPLPGDDFVPVYNRTDLEKVNFPSNEKPIPTYSAAFGKGNEVPPPSQMFPARMGPRFFNRSAEPFETPSTMSVVTVPSLAMTRAKTEESYTGNHDRGLKRASDGSDKSLGSIDSYYSYSSSGNSHMRSESDEVRFNGRRWMIE